MTIAITKAEARETAFAARKLAFEAGQGRAADLLADYLGRFRTPTLSGYMPMRTEINPLAAMAAHQGLRNLAPLHMLIKKSRHHVRI